MTIIWSSDAPLRCKLFSWLAIQGRCLTADVLARRGMIHNEFCSFCLTRPENAVHLLGTCPLALQLWCTILSRAQLPACFTPHATSSLLDWLEDTTKMLPKPQQRNWIALSQLVWWTLWKERNSRIFNRRASTISEIFNRITEDCHS